MLFACAQTASQLEVQALLLRLASAVFTANLPRRHHVDCHGAQLLLAQVSNVSQVHTWTCTQKIQAIGSWLRPYVMQSVVLLSMAGIAHGEGQAARYSCPDMHEDVPASLPPLPTSAHTHVTKDTSRKGHIR